MRRPREISGQPRQKARGHTGKRQRLIGVENALQRLAHRAIRM
jgi:hypothetical protein